MNIDWRGNPFPPEMHWSYLMFLTIKCFEKVLSVRITFVPGAPPYTFKNPPFIPIHLDKMLKFFQNLQMFPKMWWKFSVSLIHFRQSWSLGLCPSGTLERLCFSIWLTLVGRLALSAKYNVVRKYKVERRTCICDEQIWPPYVHI